jgi:hypothetical protein
MSEPEYRDPRERQASRRVRQLRALSVAAIVLAALAAILYTVLWRPGPAELKPQPRPETAQRVAIPERSTSLEPVVPTLREPATPRPSTAQKPTAPLAETPGLDESDPRLGPGNATDVPEPGVDQHG